MESSERLIDDPNLEYIFPASIVLHLTKDPNNITFLKKSILPQAVRAGLRYTLHLAEFDDSVYCSVFASHQRLLVEADRLCYELELDPMKVYEAECGFHGFRSTTSSFDPTKYKHLYAKYSNSSPATVKELFVVHKLGLVSLPFPTVTSSVLKQSDAIKLLFCILTTKDEGPGTGAQLDLDRWVHNAQHSHKTFEKLQSYFPSHDSGRQKVVDFMSNSLIWKFPVMHMRHYFGERVAMYFAFLEHFTHWLVAPAIVGSIAFMNQLWSSSPDIWWLPLLSIFLVLWSTVFIQSWKRTEASWAMRWGTSKFEATEVLRTEFCLNVETERRVSPLTGKVEYSFPNNKHAVRRVYSASVVGVLVIMVVSVVFSIFIARVLLEVGEMEGTIPKGWGSYIAMLANAIQIQVLGYLYPYMAKALTDYENHETHTQYEDALITKTCLFTLVNSYFSLFYIAFLKNRIMLFGHHQECAAGHSGKPDCMNELRSTLVVVFITQLIVGNFNEVILPFIFNHLSMIGDMCCCRRTSLKPHSLEVESALPKYDPFEDYLEQLVLYGYVTLFVVAFPLAPLLGLINNLVEIRVDSFKLLYNCARPIPQGAQHIGSWRTFLDVITYMSIASNLGVTIFTDSEFLPEWTMSSKLLLFLGLERIVLILKFALSSVISDTPYVVSDRLKLQSTVVEKHVLQITPPPSAASVGSQALVTEAVVEAQLPGGFPLPSGDRLQ